MRRISKIVVQVAALVHLGSCATSKDLNKLADEFDHKLARTSYLHECDWCDLAFEPGSLGHQACIIKATKKWIKIKKRRNWK